MGSVSSISFPIFLLSGLFSSFSMIQKQRKIANLKEGDWDEQEKRSGFSEDTKLGNKFDSEELNFGD